MAMAVLAAESQNLRWSSSSGMIYVDDDGICGGNSPCYTTVQDGVDAANSGDMVYVYSGTYSERVSIAKSDLVLTGENRNGTIIDAGDSGSVISIDGALGARNVEISGFTVRNGQFGIRAELSSNLTITDNSIRDNRYFNPMHTSAGIYLLASVNNTITNNDVSNNGQNPLGAGIYLHYSSSNIIGNNNISSNYRHGILLESSSHNDIADNILTDNVFYGMNLISSNDNAISGNYLSTYTWAYGIQISSSLNNSLTGNDFVNSGIALGGDRLSHYNSHMIPTSNIVNGKPAYYYKDCAGLDID
jgi:parallel beta-helix repeat protein